MSDPLGRTRGLQAMFHDADRPEGRVFRGFLPTLPVRDSQFAKSALRLPSRSAILEFTPSAFPGPRLDWRGLRAAV